MLIILPAVIRTTIYVRANVIKYPTVHPVIGTLNSIAPKRFCIHPRDINTGYREAADRVIWVKKFFP